MTLSGDLTTKSSVLNFSGGTVSVVGNAIKTFNSGTLNFSGNTTFDVTGQIGYNHFATSSTLNIGAGDGSISAGTLEADSMTINWASGSEFSFSATNVLDGGATSSWESLWNAGQMTYDSQDYTTLGVWSVVTNTDGLASGVRFDYDDATKTLTIVSDAPALEGYDLWATTWDTDIGAATNDLDSDGVSNFGEYALGGNPTNVAVQGSSPVFSKSGNGFIYVHPMRSDDETITYLVETTTNLISGAWTNLGVSAVGTNVTGGTLDFVSNEVEIIDNEKFIRLKIEQ
jgi:hypothetical protein